MLSVCCKIFAFFKAIFKFCTIVYEDIPFTDSFVASRDASLDINWVIPQSFDKKGFVKGADNKQSIVWGYKAEILKLVTSLYLSKAKSSKSH